MSAKLRVRDIRGILGGCHASHDSWPARAHRTRGASVRVDGMEWLIVNLQR